MGEIPEEVKFVFVVTPADELTIPEKRKLESDIENYLFRKATTEFKKPPEAFILRKGIPDVDFGLTRSVWEESITTKDAYNDKVIAKDREVPERTIICIYGVGNLATNPLSTMIRFRKGEARIIGEAFFENLYAREIVLGYFERPIIYSAGEVMNIDLWAKATGTDRVYLLVKVIEPEGKRISPERVPESE